MSYIEQRKRVIALLAEQFAGAGHPRLGVLTPSQARTAAKLTLEQDDGFVDGAEGPCDMVSWQCGRTDLHGHSGFEQIGVGGDGDFYTWYVPA